MAEDGAPRSPDLRSGAALRCADGPGGAGRVVGSAQGATARALPTRHCAAITDTKEVGPLLRVLNGYAGTLTVRCALGLAPLVFVGPGELIRADWASIDQLTRCRRPARRMWCRSRARLWRSSASCIFSRDSTATPSRTPAIRAMSVAGVRTSSAPARPSINGAPECVRPDRSFADPGAVGQVGQGRGHPKLSRPRCSTGLGQCARLAG